MSTLTILIGSLFLSTAVWASDANEIIKVLGLREGSVKVLSGPPESCVGGKVLFEFSDTKSYLQIGPKILFENIGKGKIKIKHESTGCTQTQECKMVGTRLAHDTAITSCPTQSVANEQIVREVFYQRKDGWLVYEKHMQQGKNRGLLTCIYEYESK